MTQGSAFLTFMRRHPERPAFDVGGSTLSYGELERRARRYAARLVSGGVAPGDRVALFCPSAEELLVALVAHLRLGVVHVPINTRYRGQEIAHILRDSGARVLLTDSGSAADLVAEALPPAQRPWRVRRDDEALSESSGEVDWPWLSHPAPEDTALLIYTSGTTGKSKGVALSHRALTANIGAVTNLWRFSTDDHLALALPLFHVHGLGLGVLGTLLHGARAEVFDRFDAASIVASFRDRGATVFMGVPTMHARLLAHLDANPGDAAHLRVGRLFTSGSAPLPAASLARFEAHTGHRILERYGMSETGFTLSNPYEGARREGTVGVPVPGYEVRVVDEAGLDCAPGETGEIWVRGDGLMSGYWRNVPATRAAFRDGWFVTGDVATVGDDGYHRIVGRKSSDIIKSGGFKIAAREIEDVIRRDPRVADVAVVGVPDDEWGEVIGAAVVLRRGCESSAGELLPQVAALVAQHIADYKRPRRLVVLPQLPTNALGKVQKHRLARLFA